MFSYAAMRTQNTLSPMQVEPETLTNKFWQLSVLRKKSVHETYWPKTLPNFNYFNKLLTD